MYAYAVGFIIVTIVMLSAAYQDLRSREVSDVHWAVICVVAAAMSALQGDLEGILAAVTIALVTVFMLSPRVEGATAAAVVIAAIVSTAIAYWISGNPSHLVRIGMFLFFAALYYTGLVKGGADAKALMALSMAFPVYPPFGSLLFDPVYPAGLVFNPVFSSFLIGLVIAVLCSLPRVIGNIRSGDRPLDSYVMRISEAKGAFIWPVEDMVDGQRQRVPPSDDAEACLERLEDNGFTEVRVTPMIPFIVPLAAGFLITIIVGCPLFALI
jgi:preflagellin peptidase FlaK